VYYWLFLVAAIVFEVIGTITMKYHIDETPFLGLSIMYIMLALSYGAFAIAVKRIHLAVAYGAWESLGLVLICVSCTLLFAEPMNILKIGGILAIIAGILLLKVGSVDSKNKDVSKKISKD
jgi:spermidine export protein MdtJ